MAKLFLDAPLIEPGEADIRHGGTPVPSSYFRPIFKGNLMANGGYNQEKGDAVIATGEADLVSFGTLFLANPDLPERFRLSAPLNQPEPATFYGGGEKRYTDYPAIAV